MSTQLAAQDVNMDELKRMGMMFALSGFFDTSGPQEVAVAQMAVKVLAGREIGFGPFAAVNGIHIIKGKPSISANIMAAAVKSHPTYDYRVRVMTDKEVAIDFFEIVDGKREAIGTSEFNAADAAKAGTQNMSKFPRNMLFARAMSNGVRWYCPDVFSGNTVYTPEELGARTDDDGYIIVDRTSGEVIESPRLSSPAPAKKNEPAPAIESLDDVEELNFDDIPSPQPGQTASAHTAQQADAPAKMGDKTRRHFHAVGVKLYGDEWEDKRYEIVKAITKGAAESSNDLTEAQAKTLIAGMEKRISESQAEASDIPA